jgi:hypothetical protein
MFHLRRAIVSSVIAWVVATAFLLICGAATGADGIWSPRSIGQASSLVGMVVFPTCLLIVAPLLKLLPDTSRFWMPHWACGLASIVGPIAMYLWTVPFAGRFFVPDLGERGPLTFASAAMCAAVAFAYTYTVGVARPDSQRKDHRKAPEHRAGLRRVPEGIRSGAALVSSIAACLLIAVVVLSWWISHPSDVIPVIGPAGARNRAFIEDRSFGDISKVLCASDWPYTFSQPNALGTVTFPEAYSASWVYWSADGSVLAFRVVHRGQTVPVYEAAYDYRKHASLDYTDNIEALLESRGGLGPEHTRW